MKKALLAVLALFPTLTGCGETSLASKALEDQRHKFVYEVDEARKRLGLEGSILILTKEIIVSKQGTLGMATGVDTVGAAGPIRIFVRPVFLMEGFPTIFEHVAHHELCHVKNGDFEVSRPFHEAEMNAERCVLEAVGAPRYCEYLWAYEAWKPEDASLKNFRKEFVDYLRSTKACAMMKMR